MRFLLSLYIYIYIHMSYDKYIKYKNKYLQLKAKYTQVGGNLIWVIDNLLQHGPPATTPITQEESALLVLNSTSGKQQVIEFGHLRNANGHKLKNEKGEMNYKYVINADGRTGTRSSKKGTYKMTLTFIPDDIPRASAPPLSIPPHSASGSSAYAPPAYPSPPHASAYSQPQRSASGASAYAPPATPAPRAYGASAYAPPATPPPHAYDPTLGSISASGVTDVSIPLSNFKSYGSPGATDATDYRPPRASAYAPPATPPPRASASGAYAPPPPAPRSPDQIGPLPPFMELDIVELKNKPKYKVLIVTDYGISDGFTKEKEGAIFNKINDEQINMTFRGNTYPLKPTANAYQWVYNYDYEV